MRVSRGITQDAEFEELGRRGYTGNLNDRQYKLLGNMGLRGALTDRIGSSSISAYALAAVDNKLPPLVMDFKEEDYFSNNTIGSFAEVAEHSRAGNATMTDSSGNIVWAPHNLLTYSEDFSNWTQSDITLSSNATAAPDGATTADKIVPNTAVAAHRVTKSETSSVGKTFSVYAKPAGYSWIILQTPVGYVWFDVENGVVGTETSASGAIEQSDNGFYKCTVTSSSVASGVFYIWAVSQNNQTSFAGDGTSGIYIWGAHLYRSDLGGMADVPADERAFPTATKYVRTAGRVIGPELVTNGTFDTDTDWTKGAGWTISGGVASFPSGADANISQSSILTVGKVYQVTFDVTAISSGNLAYYVGTSGASGTINTVGSYTNIATATANGNLAFRSLSATGISIDNVSVKEINPLALSIQMKGEMTYADTGAAVEARPFRWYINSSNNIDVWLRTDGAFSGAIEFKQGSSGISDFVRADPAYSPDINVPFNIASRHGSTFINGAVDGVALTEDTTPVALPDLENTDLELAYDFMGTIDTFRVWADDLGDTGIEEATS